MDIRVQLANGALCLPGGAINDAHVCGTNAWDLIACFRCLEHYLCTSKDLDMVQWVEMTAPLIWTECMVDMLN